MKNMKKMYLKGKEEILNNNNKILRNMRKSPNNILNLYIKNSIYGTYCLLFILICFVLIILYLFYSFYLKIGFIN